MRKLWKGLVLGAIVGSLIDVPVQKRLTLRQSIAGSCRCVNPW